MQMQNEIIHDDAQAAAPIAGVRLANGAAIDPFGQRWFIGWWLAHAAFLLIDLAPRLTGPDGDFVEKP
jgi:hypothetical protein